LDLSSLSKVATVKGVKPLTHEVLMVVPIITPSNLLSSTSALKSVEGPVTGGRICGSRFRREASGALSVLKMRLSPNPTEKPGFQTWFEADEALIEQNLSSIKGTGRIRLGLGERTVEGESFTLLTEEKLFLLSQVVLRSRDPMLRVTANRLRAKYKLDSKTGSPMLETLELIGSVNGSVVLPWRDETQKFDVQAGRVLLDLRQDKTIISFSGSRRDPATLKSRNGSISLSSEQGILSFDSEQIHFDGEIQGSGRLSGAALFSPDDRTEFHVTRAQSFTITASLEEPLWWAGDANSCNFDRMVIHNAECGERLLGEVLVLQDPGFAKGPISPRPPQSN
jgi:hypothetical protein